MLKIGPFWIAPVHGIVGLHMNRGDLKLKAPWCREVFSERYSRWRWRCLRFRLFRTGG